MKHTKRLFWITGLLIIAFSLSTAAPAAQADKYKALLGEWDAQTEDGQYTFVFKFMMKEGTIAGTFEGQSGETEMKDIVFENNELKFMVDLDMGGQSLAIDFAATIDGETLEGMLSMEYGEANITGSKRK